MSKRAKPGDILELTAPDGLIYIQYLGKHQGYGDAIVVCPRKHSSRVPATPELLRHGYITFYPVNAAIRQGLATVTGNMPSPGIPARWRRPGVRKDGLIKTWVIENGSQEILKEQLSDADLQLPIASIWNHEFLIQRVSEGWRPELEGRNE